MKKITGSRAADCLVDKYIGSAYDHVKSVSENINAVKEVNENINSVNTVSAHVAEIIKAFEVSPYKGEWTPETDVEIGGIYGYQGSEWRSLTGADTAPVEGDDWREMVSTGYVTGAQGELIGGVVFPSSGDLAVGMTVPIGTTHLRVSGGLYAMSPIATGIVTVLTSTGATIGGVSIGFYKENTKTLASTLEIPSLSGSVSEEQKVFWQGYYSASDGGSNWGTVKFGSHVQDGFSIFSIDANTYIVASLKGKSLNVRKAGAKGDKVTDDTARINLVKNYAQNNIVGRFDSGLEIRIPEGDFRLYAPSGGTAIEVTSSRIYIGGVSWSSSVLYAPNADFDLVHFNGTALSLYGCGMSRVRFNTPGNASAGCQLRTTKCIDCTFDKLYFVGHFDGLISDGSARTYFTSVIFTQDTRNTLTSPRYAMDFQSYSGVNNSDVHVNTYQIFMPDDRKTTYSVSIRGADGIYFCNGHQQGGVLVQPDGEGLNVCASVSWSQVYLDKADSENIIFTGQSAVYRNFEFSPCYMRGSQLGMVINTTVPISDIRWTGGRCANHTKSGIDMRNDLVRGLIVNGVTMADNCTANNLGDSDILVRGHSHIFSTIVFKGGASNGRGLNLTNQSTNCTVSNLDFTQSTQGIRLIDSGSGNKLGVLNGVTFKNKGTVSVPAGSNVVTVPHGMSIAPDIDSIFIQQRTTIAPATNIWVSNVTSTSFNVNLNSAPANNAVLSWFCDMTD